MKNLAWIMGLLGVTQTDLAKTLGISQKNVWRWSVYERRATQRNVERVAKALNVAPWTLNADGLLEQMLGEIGYGLNDSED